MLYISLDQAKKSLPYIEEHALFRAVDLALWLIIEKDESLKKAIDTAYRKHTPKTKKSVEVLVRSAFPDDYFIYRSQGHRPSKIAGDRLSVHDKKHMKSITGHSRGLI